MKKERQTMSEFEIWMGQIDRMVNATAMVSVHDLPDSPFRDWFDSGMAAADAAEQALRDAGWY